MLRMQELLETTGGPALVWVWDFLHVEIVAPTLAVSRHQSRCIGFFRPPQIVDVKSKMLLDYFWLLFSSSGLYFLCIVGFSVFYFILLVYFRNSSHFEVGY